MQELLSAVLLIIGAMFILVGGLGLVRLPDIFMRMSSNTKAATLGIGCILLAVAIYFNNLGITSRALATIGFLFLTAPIAAHMIGRAAYFVGVPLWDKTVTDELRGRYNLRNHTLGSNGERGERWHPESHGQTAEAGSTDQSLIAE